MNLPNAGIAIVAREKVFEYLLNPQHPDGAGKAGFFGSLGFRRDGEDWQTLAIALRGIAVHNEIAQQVDSSHGAKYIVDGEIGTPVGRRVRGRTVWILDSGGVVPRLVTAYPTK